MTINGFETYTYPEDQRITWLRQNGNFRVAGFYLAHKPGQYDQGWLAKRQYLATNGWGFLPTYVGLQKGNPGLSAPAGKNHAIEAVGLMGQAGFAAPSVVYLDLEEGDTPTGAYASYISAWVAEVSNNNYVPAIYCSHVFIGWARQQTPIIWSFHIPSNTFGDTYDPNNLPVATIDAQCIATQYRQKVNLIGLTIPAAIDSEGLDLDLCAVADPSNVAIVHHALGIN